MLKKQQWPICFGIKVNLRCILEGGEGGGRLGGGGEGGGGLGGGGEGGGGLGGGGPEIGQRPMAAKSLKWCEDSC